MGSKINHDFYKSIQQWEVHKWVHVLCNWIKNFQNLSPMKKLQYDQTSCLEHDDSSFPIPDDSEKYAFFPDETTRLSLL